MLKIFKKGEMKCPFIQEGKGLLLKITEKDIQKQIQMINLIENDLQRINSVRPIILENIDEVVHNFYETLLAEDSLLAIVNSKSSVHRLKVTLKRHIIEMFDGVIDSTYVHRRYKIAHIHAQIGLKAKWYMCAFQNLQVELTEIISRNVNDKNQANDIIVALTKVMSLEQQIVLETYDEQIDKAKEDIRGRSQALGTKVIASADELAEVVVEASDSFVQINEYASGVLTLSNENHKISLRAKDQAGLGLNSLQTHSFQMDDINSEIVDIGEYMNGLSEKLSETSQIVGMVTSIADQTNLLSLNAQIEAARAGTAGKGFAVVAHEVRKLSDETKKSVQKITDLLGNTSTQMDLVTSRLNKMVSTVEESNVSMQETKDQFNHIVNLARDTDTHSNEMKAQIEDLVAILEQTSHSFNIISKSSDQLTKVSRTVFDNHLEDD